MKQGLRCQRILILSLLSISVFAPIFLVSIRLSNFNSSLVHEEIIDDLSGIKYKTDTVQKLNSIQQETGEGLKEQPTLVVYKDEDLNSIVRRSNTGGRTSLLQKDGTDYDVKEDNQQIIIEQKIVLSPPVEKNQERPNQNTVKKEANGLQQNQLRPNQNTVKKEANGLQPRRITDEKVKEMKDQVIRAKAYLNFAPPGSNSHFVKELRLRIKEVERALGEATKDSDLSRSALQRMRTMEASLSKAGRIYNDCSAMAMKLRAMTYNTEELVRAQKNQATYLIQLALRTTPKGLHCLSMRLTDDYFTLQPDERKLPNQQKLQEPDLYHFAVFSDNILSCAVVVNSTISSAMEEEKTVFHVVTDTINLPAITMWFLLNPPGQATIQIQSVEDFEWLPSKYGSVFRMQDSRDPRYTSALNHLRFYLPEVFPTLNKIVLLDHDVVVQRDLRGLWEIDMKGKVNGAVETCREGDISFRGMDALINFTDPIIAENFDAKACTWAFGMNVFDLQEWRRRNLTTVYSKYLELGKQRQLWTGGSLPLGQVTFYNLTVALDRRWHVLGLGYDSGLGKGEIERAAVIHYDGNMKPWLEIGIGKYKGYWTRYVKYDHPFLQQCNIHE